MVVNVAFNPYFSSEGGLISSDFESTGASERVEYRLYFRVQKTTVDSKGKRETVILVRNAASH